MSSNYRAIALLLLSWPFFIQAGELPSPSLTQDNNLASQIAPTTAAPATENNVARTAKISAIVIGCELDEKCIISSLHDTMKNDPSAMYETALMILDGQNKQIEDAQSCKSAETIKIKKEVAGCLNSVVTKFSQLQSGIPRSEMTNELNVCMKTKMESLAKEGNLFAQGLLANRASRTNDLQAKNYWEQLIKSQAGTPEYELFQRCSQSFQLIPPGLGKGFMAAATINSGEKPTTQMPESTPIQAPVPQETIAQPQVPVQPQMPLPTQALTPEQMQFISQNQAAPRMETKTALN